MAIITHTHSHISPSRLVYHLYKIFTENTKDGPKQNCPVCFKELRISRWTWSMSFCVELIFIRLECIEKRQVFSNTWLLSRTQSWWKGKRGWSTARSNTLFINLGENRQRNRQEPGRQYGSHHIYVLFLSLSPSVCLCYA